MKRIVGLTLAVLALSSSQISSQSSAQFSGLNTSLNAVAGGAGTVGTPFTAPPGSDAALVTWTTSYSAPPASVTMLLQASLDNTTWFTLDTSTAVAGELRNIATSARFFRCNISAVSGAVNKTCSFVLKRSNAAVSSQGSVFAGTVSSNRFLAGDGTAGAPSYSFTSEPGIGWYRGSAGWIGFANDNGSSLNPASFGPSSLVLGSTYLLGWNNVTTTLGAAPDLTLRRSGTGSLLLGNSTVSTDFGLLQFGGTTSAFPALKRVGTRLDLRLADDSGATSMLIQNLYATKWEITPVLFANLVAPANGTVQYCSDCTITAVCAGAGTGAFAKRLNGVWVCN